MKTAVIVAGGTGTRMNSPSPKQFSLLNGIPVLSYSITAFFSQDPSIRILVALPGQLFESWNELQVKYNLTIHHELVAGGETRFHSVSNCLDRIEPSGLVAIHDAARPLITPTMIGRLFTEAEKRGNAVPVVPVNESIREVTGPYSHPADRSRIRIVQTPQIFHSSQLKTAYRQPYAPAFTDDATVVESLGEKIHLVEGDRANLKITYPADILLAEALLAGKK